MSDAHPAVGQPAPAFDMPSASGGRVKLSDLTGKIVVLYFYPKDDTPGCTQEAISFSEKADEFAAIGAQILGVSRDSVGSHQKFAAKHDLRLTLASDDAGEATAAYGVWVEKSMYGRTYMGIERATFLIAPDGRIAQVWRKVKVKGHAEAVLAAARALAA